MALTPQQRERITKLLTNQVQLKLTLYWPETSNMPFHTRLLGKDRMALFSFIHSMNTTLGVSVFEQTAVIVAQPNFKRAISQYKEFGNSISSEAQRVIQGIVDYLKMARVRSDKIEETAKVLAVARSGTMRQVKRPRIDLFLEANDGAEYYIDIKTAKPNIGESAGLKRTLLEWVAIRGAENPKAKIHTMLAVPYNPYAPEPYQRYTLKGMFDLEPPYTEILVAEEFWDFLGGPNSYVELLDLFEEVGKALRPVVDKKFQSFA